MPKRRSRTPFSWKQEYGGVPAWGITAGLALIVVLFAVPVVVNATTPASAPYVRPTDAFTDPTPTETPTAPATVEQVRELVATSNPLTVSVLGDSTGNSDTEWVALWAQHLAESATVTVHFWDDVAGSYGAPVVYGEGDRQIEIWNGALPGRTADDGLAAIEALQPAAPGLLILNYGHNQAATPIGAGLANIVSSTETRWELEGVPTVAIIQNPARGDRAALTAGSQDAVIAWAAEEGIPTVNVRDAFLANPNWAAEWMTDVVHPNDAGSVVWADAVIAALG